VQFLDTLHPPGQPSATDAAEAAAGITPSNYESVGSTSPEPGMSTTKKPDGK
jgi:hypothetical protein